MSQYDTPLQKKRLIYIPKIPSILKNIDRIRCEPLSEKIQILPEIAEIFPYSRTIAAYKLTEGKQEERKALSVGILFSGGPAPGGHNVLAGLFDTLKKIDKQSKLIGFLGGFSGLLDNKHRELQQTQIDAVRNQGGFDLIGSGRAKLEKMEHLQTAMKVAKEHSLDAIVVIGGDDSNTNAAILAEYFISQGCTTQVIGIPKTIDGDLRSKDIELSFGFDTACKTYSAMIGNIERDAISTAKYYHFIKLMGRSASHVALECALKTQPNWTLIGEEAKPLTQIVTELVDLIVQRSALGKDYGVVLVPEGLLEFIPEMRALISELNELLPTFKPSESTSDLAESIEQGLSEESKKTFKLLSKKIQMQLLLGRDPHGNVKVSQIQTEQLLIELVKRQLKKRGLEQKIYFQEHFFGYEGRSALPSNFDADYTYSLGLCAALAVRDKLTGVICAIRHLKEPSESWEVKFIPILPLMRLEKRGKESKAVIDKTLVDLKGPCFLHFSLHRKQWALEDHYRFEGPIQFFGDLEITDTFPLALIM